jgi:hypothetical protein
MTAGVNVVVCRGIKVDERRTPCPRNSVKRNGIWVATPRIDQTDVDEQKGSQYDTCPACTILLRNTRPDRWDSRMGKYGIMYDLLDEVRYFVGREPSDKLVLISEDPEVEERIKLISQAILASQFSILDPKRIRSPKRSHHRRIVTKFLLETLVKVVKSKGDLTGTVNPNELDPETCELLSTFLRGISDDR